MWLIQNALFGDEAGYDNFIAAIDHTGDRRIPLDYVFWESTIDLKLTGTVPSEVIPFGTRAFVCYGRQHGWCVYWDDSYQYPSLCALGKEFINWDLETAPLDELEVPDTGKVYIREAAGFNIIKGKVINGYAWPDWVRGFKSNVGVNPRYHDWHPIDGTTLFVMAPVKTIIDEYRVWIIDRKVVSSSQYVVQGKVKYSNTDNDQYVNGYAQEIADSLQFGTGNYVLDVFRTEQGLRVGEINCIHCSGWYAIDSVKVVEALSSIQCVV